MATTAAKLRTMTRARPGRLDVAFTLALSAVGLVLMLSNVADAAVEASPAAVPAFLLVTGTLLWRSTAPLIALTAAAVAIAAHVAVFGTVVRCGVVFPLEFLLVFSAGARLPRRQALAGLALGLAGVTFMTLDDGQVGPEVLPFFGPLTAGVWGLGRVVHSRNVLVDELESRTAELRRTRDDRARLEVETDRARLSAELDRLLQRRLGELAALAVPSADPDTAVARFTEIEHRSRRTLDEMRAMVGVLRSDEVPTAPQPTLRHLETLLGHARLQVEGSPRVLPAGVELVVSGPVRRSCNADSALERARERVELHHGTFVATRARGRAEAIAQLPVAMAGV